jgi:hypothetical protein
MARGREALEERCHNARFADSGVTGNQHHLALALLLDGYLVGKTWLVDERLTLADFSVGGVIPSAQAMDLSINKYPEIPLVCAPVRIARLAQQAEHVALLQHPIYLAP